MISTLIGTTTATVLTRAIFAEALKNVSAGINPMDLRRGITAAVDAVVEVIFFFFPLDFFFFFFFFILIFFFFFFFLELMIKIIYNFNRN